MHSKLKKKNYPENSILINSVNNSEDESNLSLFVVQCDLVSEDGKESRSHVFNPSSATSPPASSGIIINIFF